MAAITRDQVAIRLDQLRKSLTQMEANLHAQSGAIQDCEHWLAELDAQEDAETAAAQSSLGGMPALSKNGAQ